MPNSLANEMLPLFSEHAKVEGLVEGNYPGLHFYCISKPSSFKKVQFSGTRLVAVAQGSKRARLHDQELAYDASRYLVMSGETEVCGTVLEATPERPYLAMCLELSAELVAKNLLAFAADSSAALSPEPSDERSPAASAASEDGSLAFVSALDQPVTDAVTRFVRALGDPLDRRVVAPLAMEELVFRLLRTSAAKVVRNAVQAGDEAINQAMRYMRQNASAALSVEQVARHVGMSPSHFAHRFSAVARTTPMRFLKQVRLEAARDLLVLSRLRAGEAAQRVGYESTSHFNRDFKAAYGATPASYARQLREG